jgi:hypothetical protein
MTSPHRSYLVSLLGCFAILAGLLAALLVWVDPYAERQGGQFKTFVASTMTVRKFMRMLEERPRILVFGTSRSRLLDSDVLGGDMINLHALYGNPKAVRDFLSRLNDRQLGNIREVYYLLDRHTFEGDAYRDTLDYTSAVEILGAWLGRGGNYVRDALDKVFLNVRGGWNYEIRDNGASRFVTDPVFDGRSRTTPEHRVTTSDAIAALAEVAAILHAHGISVHFFTPPLPQEYWPLMDMDGYQAQMRAFASVLDEFTDMTVLDGVSTERSLFEDNSHLNMAGTRRVFGARPLPGPVVTRDTVESHLQRVRTRMAGRLNGC